MGDSQHAPISGDYSSKAGYSSVHPEDPENTVALTTVSDDATADQNSCRKSSQNAVARHFEFEKRGTTFPKEIRGALTTFMTLSYILIVNPKTISPIKYCDSHPGECLDRTDVFLATALSACVGSLTVGLGGNLPFALSSGVGLSSYFSYGLVMSSKAPMNKYEALATVVLAGIALCMLAAAGATKFVIEWVPQSIKHATIVGMGLLISFVGCQSVGVVVTDAHSVVALGDWSREIVLSACGVVLLAALSRYKIPGAMLITILVNTLISWAMKADDGGGNETKPPDAFLCMPEFHTNMMADVFTEGLAHLTTDAILPAFTFTIVVLLDVAGTTYGITQMAGLEEKPNWAFGGCALATLLGGIMGTTPIIVAIESSAGINDGAVTGFSAVIVGMLFFLFTFFSPLLDSIPANATCPVLVVIGMLMMQNVTLIDWTRVEEAMPAFLTIVIMPFTFSITNGLVVGLVVHYVLWLIHKAIEWCKQRCTCCSCCIDERPAQDPAEPVDAELICKIDNDQETNGKYGQSVCVTQF